MQNRHKRYPPDTQKIPPEHKKRDLKKRVNKLVTKDTPRTPKKDVGKRINTLVTKDTAGTHKK